MNKKLKKSILSLSVMGLILGVVSVNTFAASGNHNRYSKSAYAYTHSSYGGGKIETKVRLNTKNSFGSKVITGYATKTTYGSMSNGVTKSSDKNVIGAHSTHRVQGLESYYSEKWSGSW